MTRRELRENTFVLLFRTDFHNEEELPEQYEMFFDTMAFSMEQPDRTYVEDKVNNICRYKKQFDEEIGSVSETWEVSRIDKVTLNILRLALYEMEYDDTIPVKVSINEAIELAKKFGPDDASAFVNGILGKLAK